MKILVYTAVLRLFGPALKTHFEAIDRSRGAVEIDHWLDYTNTPGAAANDACLIKYSRAQQQFLAGDYDALITLEDDMLIPVDGINRLLAALHDGVDVAYGLYVWRHGFNHRWCAYRALSETGGRSWSDGAYDALLFPAWEQKQRIPVAGVGLGFTAIKRAAVKAIPFSIRGPAAPDWYFAVDAQKLGLRQECDLNILCGHMAMQPSPRIYWPDLHHEGRHRTEFLD